MSLKRYKDGEQLPSPKYPAPLNTRRAVVTKGDLRKFGANIENVDDFMISNPALEPSSFLIPDNRKSLNAYIRWYDKYHPLVGNIIDLHSTYPLSKFTFTGVNDEEVLDFYNEIAYHLRLFRKMMDVSREYHLLGEVYPFMSWDSKLGYWDNITILDPDYVEVEGDTVISEDDVRYFLIPNEALRKIVMSPDPYDVAVKEKLDPIVVQAVQSGYKIPLSKFNLVQLARKLSPYDLRGTSIVLRALKSLLYEDKLIEAQFAIAQRHIIPLTIFKVGDAQNMPEQEDLEALRAILKEGINDPNFALIYWYGLNVEFAGATGKLLNVHPEFEFTTKRILAALFTNEAMITGVGPTYANASIAMKVQQSRYAYTRDMLEDWVINDIYRPVAYANDIYIRNPKEINARIYTSKNFGRKIISRRKLFETNTQLHRGQKLLGEIVAYRGSEYLIDRLEGDRVILASSSSLQLNLPKIAWQGKLNLVENEQKMQYIMTLQSQSKMPMKLICDIFDLDYDYVKTWLVKEKHSIFDPEYAKKVFGTDKLPEGGGALGMGGTPAPGGFGESPLGDALLSEPIGEEGLSEVIEAEASSGNTEFAIKNRLKRAMDSGDKSEQRACIQQLRALAMSRKTPGNVAGREEIDKKPQTIAESLREIRGQYRVEKEEEEIVFGSEEDKLPDNPRVIAKNQNKIFAKDKSNKEKEALKKGDWEEHKIFSN